MTETKADSRPAEQWYRYKRLRELGLTKTQATLLMEQNDVASQAKVLIEQKKCPPWLAYRILRG